MAPVNRTEAQFEARKNHYLEKIGKGKPKAKGTKSNPLKGKDLAEMLKERFNKKNKNANVAAPQQANINELPALVEQETKAAEKAQQTITKTGAKTPAEPQTFGKYAEANGLKYEQPKSGVIEADRRAAEAIKQNALKQEALANAEAINKPFSTSAAQIDKQLGMGHQNPVAPGYENEVGKLLNEKDAAKKAAEPKTWGKYAEEHGTKYEQPKSGVIEADRRAAETIKQNAMKQEAAAKTPAEPKTWKKYAEEHGTKYEQPTSGVIEADRRAAETIKQNALKQEAAAKTPAEPKTWKKYAEEHGTKYEQPTSGVIEADRRAAEAIKKNETKKPPVDGPSKPPVDNIKKPPVDGPSKPPVDNIKKPPIDVPGKPPKPPVDVKEAVDTAKKPGFFKKIGNFFKSKKGKWALLGAAVIGLAALCLSKCTGGKDKPVPPVTPDPTTPTEATTPTEPTNDKYCIDTEEGKMPKSYTIQKGNYPVGIIADTYGVAYGTPEFKEIQKAVYEASGYQRNTNLKVGDKFTLPDVTIGDKVYTADENAKVRKGTIANNGLQLGHTKEVVKAGDKFYIVYCESGQRVPNEPAYDNMDKACERVDALLAEEKAEEKKAA